MPTMTAALPTPNSSRRTLLLLATIFFLPFFISSGLFWLDWRPGKFANHGDLLQPPRPLPETGLLHGDGRPLPSTELRGKWLLLMPVQDVCNASCQTRLQQMLQVHVALNKEQSRLQRVLFVGGAADTANLVQVQQRFPDLVIASVPSGTAVDAWERALDGRGHPIYIVDPLGNVMMRYAEPNDLRGVLKDLERLLKYSWIR
ncbi:hypothetical protein [Propionivibrio sp.]|uniref:SCO family protein n=1 Tax=Propionivibrio sp. TaxID=2212460 RepID=UPI0026397B6C|nr:hypothetical protein [Propionivibrio sp.]